MELIQFALSYSSLSFILVDRVMEVFMSIMISPHILLSCSNLLLGHEYGDEKKEKSQGIGCKRLCALINLLSLFPVLSGLYVYLFLVLLT